MARALDLVSEEDLWRPASICTRQDNAIDLLVAEIYLGSPPCFGPLHDDRREVLQPGFRRLCHIQAAGVRAQRA
jgi:hypothetical protein